MPHLAKKADDFASYKNKPEIGCLWSNKIHVVLLITYFTLHYTLL